MSVLFNILSIHFNCVIMKSLGYLLSIIIETIVAKPCILFILILFILSAHHLHVKEACLLQRGKSHKKITYFTDGESITFWFYIESMFEIIMFERKRAPSISNLQKSVFHGPHLIDTVYTIVINDIVIYSCKPWKDAV